MQQGSPVFHVGSFSAQDWLIVGEKVSVLQKPLPKLSWCKTSQAALKTVYELQSEYIKWKIVRCTVSLTDWSDLMLVNTWKPAGDRKTAWYFFSFNLLTNVSPFWLATKPNLAHIASANGRCILSGMYYFSTLDNELWRWALCIVQEPCM